jgi:hypothetical protein
MSRWRIVVVILLVLLPFILLAGIGSYHLWATGLGLLAWSGMMLCMSAGYLIGWYWQRQRRLLRPPDFEPSPLWTERDRQAWQLVEARATKAPEINPEKLTELDYYVDQAREMAQELASCYNPGAHDPVGALTIPEILSVIELAAHDMHELVETYVPGGHLLTINDLRLARKATDWYQSAATAYWLISAVFNPIETGLRWVSTQLGVSQPFQQLQKNLLIWFYTAYLHRLGTYLVELNSGRLRIGVERYRQLVRGERKPDAAAALASVERITQGKAEVPHLTITLLGQVKVGKSSVINALLGEQRAITDVLPATGAITRYELQPQGIPTRLVVLDTVGYSHIGPKEDQLRATEEAARQSDLLLLILHARNPARQGDLAVLQQLRAWFGKHPQLKSPPILAILTHIDLLSPALEWAPPYNWQQPQRPKEQQIAEAIAAVREQLGPYLSGVIPVCTAPGRVYGIDEGVLPLMLDLLDEARGVGLLRVLKAEIDAVKVRKIVQQLKAAAKEGGKLLWQRFLAPRS